jgi:hypothetical protein
MGQNETTTNGNNRIMIYGLKADGTYIVEFRTAAGGALAISIPRTDGVAPAVPGTGLFVAGGGSPRH